MRHDFKRSTIERLRLRVAGRCSNPDCRASTLAPGADSESVNNIGEAAHIHAASPGGPRYVAAMSIDARRSIENAIWLCATCASKVDRDVLRYTADVLRHWKNEAEALALDEHGKTQGRPASPALASLLSGLPPRLVPASISRIHASHAMLLEALDPRFEVETGFSNGATSITLRAREEVPITFNVSGENASPWMDGISGLVQFGKAASLSLDGVGLKGSPLIEELFGHGSKDGVKMLIEPIGRAAIAKINATVQGVAPQLDDVPGQLYIGESGARFQGGACGGIVKIEISLSLHDDGPPRIFNVTPAFDLWGERDVRDLPYFEKVQAFWTALALEGGVTVAVELEGRPVIRGMVDCVRDNITLERAQRNLQYMRDASVVALHLDLPIHVNLQSQMSADGVRRVALAAAIFEERYRFDASQVEKVATVRVSRQDAIELANGQSAHRLRIRQHWPSFMVFDQPIELPLVDLHLNGVALVIVHADLPAADGTVELKCVPGPEFWGTYRFVEEEGDEEDSA